MSQPNGGLILLPAVTVIPDVVVPWLPFLSLLPIFFAIRDRSWRAALLAAVISFPPVVRYLEPLLLLLPASQLTSAIALRWRVGLAGWIGFLLSGVLFWIVAAVGPRYLGWHVPTPALVLGGWVAGLLALCWSPAHRRGRDGGHPAGS